MNHQQLKSKRKKLEDSFVKSEDIVSKLSLKRILTEVSIEKVDGADVSNTEAVAGSSSKGSALMAGLLGALRAYHLWFHAAHNLTKGTGFKVSNEPITSGC